MNDDNPPQCAECGFTAYALEQVGRRLLCEECLDPVDVIYEHIGCSRWFDSDEQQRDFCEGIVEALRDAGFGVETR